MTLKKSRMTAVDRRALVLSAATRAFAQSGYAGTTTDAVAKEAGVSQPYVVRIFGSKADLFIEAFEAAMAQICAAFDRVLEEQDVDPASEEGLLPLGAAYTELVLHDRDLLQMMMHGITAGADPAIGAVTRRWMAAVHRIVLSTGCEAEQARDFVAQGMLINVILAMQAPEHLDEEPDLASLAECALGDAVRAITT